MFNFIGNVALKSSLVSIILLLILYVTFSFTQSSQGAATAMSGVVYMMISPFIMPACALWIVLKD